MLIVLNNSLAQSIIPELAALVVVVSGLSALFSHLTLSIRF
jgi:hypothetical protein